MADLKLAKFNEKAYLAVNADVKKSLDEGVHKSALEHYLIHGIDENRAPKLRREPVELRGHVDFFFVSDAGFFIVGGWLADEGCGPMQARLVGAEFVVEIQPSEVCRFARRDVEDNIRAGAYDYGFFILGSTQPRSLLKQHLQFVCETAVGNFEMRVAPQIVSGERLLNFALVRLQDQDSHQGRECNLYQFLGGAGESLVKLFRIQLAAKTKAPYVETFGRRAVARSFVTVLFGSTEPIMLQPMLFRAAGVDFGEWIYVVNSPEDASAALRIARAMSDLYGVTITVAAMADNVGFGAANNVGVRIAQSRNIYVVNPDVFPLRGGAAELNRALQRENLGETLWGGLLFYDDLNLMHSGMFVEQDVYARRDTLARAEGRRPPVKLARVEHFDKGVPFDPALWSAPKPTPAISGAVMAFDREPFERIGGFSTRYIFGHYEDADLSFRWRETVGPVMIDPDLRFMHLEGQGSRARGDQYKAAQTVNRYLFSLKYNEAFEKSPEMMVRGGAPAPQARPPAVEPVATEPLAPEGPAPEPEPNPAAARIG